MQVERIAREMFVLPSGWRAGQSQAHLINCVGQTFGNPIHNYQESKMFHHFEVVQYKAQYNFTFR